MVAPEMQTNGDFTVYSPKSSISNKVVAQYFIKVGLIACMASGTTAVANHAPAFSNTLQGTKMYPKRHEKVIMRSTPMSYSGTTGFYNIAVSPITEGALPMDDKREMDFSTVEDAVEYAYYSLHQKKALSCKVVNRTIIN